MNEEKMKICIDSLRTHVNFITERWAAKILDKEQLINELRTQKAEVDNIWKELSMLIDNCNDNINVNKNSEINNNAVNMNSNMNSNNNNNSNNSNDMKKHNGAMIIVSNKSNRETISKTTDILNPSLLVDNQKLKTKYLSLLKLYPYGRIPSNVPVFKNIKNVIDEYRNQLVPVTMSCELIDDNKAYYILKLHCKGIFRVWATINKFSNALDTIRIGCWNEDSIGIDVCTKYIVFQSLTANAISSWHFFFYHFPKSWSSLYLWLKWLQSYESLFSAKCIICNRMLVYDIEYEALLPPTFRSYTDNWPLHSSCCSSHK